MKTTFDGLSYPSDHIDFITSEEQGMDAWALTDHGNANGLTHARVHTLKVQKAGKKYRQLNGVEFYFVPSLEDWSTEYAKHQQDVKDAKTEKQKEKLAKASVVEDSEDAIDQEGLVIEDENESKQSKSTKPMWKRYYHLVVVAKNRVGLANLFTLVKKSYKYGFYRFPRIDYKMLKEHGEGLVVSTACLTGDAELISDKGTESLVSIIERYKSGEFPVVLSFNETSKELQFKRVVWGDKTRAAAKIVKIKTADGKEIRLTPDHKVLTDKGWVRADELKKNMPIKIVSL